MAITSANQLELLQTAEAVRPRKNDRTRFGHRSDGRIARSCRQIALRRGNGYPGLD